MNIVTKKGDRGETSTLFNNKLSKAEIIFDALGDLDEAHAFIGLLAAIYRERFCEKTKIDESRFHDDYYDTLRRIQQNLFTIMGQIQCLSKDMINSYLKKNFSLLQESELNLIEEQINFWQSSSFFEPQKDWALYGNTIVSGFADVASKVIRRAERKIIYLQRYLVEQEAKSFFEIINKYINRLSDYFFLFARYCEKVIQI